MSETLPGVTEMTAAALTEAHSHIGRLKGTRPWKQALPSIARAIGSTPRRIAAIVHGEAKTIYSTEMDALRRAVSEQIQSEIARLEADLAAARLASAHPTEAQVLAVSIALEQAKTLLKGTK